MKAIPETDKLVNKAQFDEEIEPDELEPNIHMEVISSDNNVPEHDSFSEPKDKYNPNFSKISQLLPDENSAARKNDIIHVVIHFTSDAEKNPENPYDIDVIYEKFKRYGVSAHYVIDWQGKIYEFVSERRAAYHAGEGNFDTFPQYDNKLSDYSIGIELMGIVTEAEMIPMMPRETYRKIAHEHIGFTEL